MQDNQESGFPSADLAYKIAIDAYDVLHKRHDVNEGKIQNALSISVAIFLAFTTVGNLLKLEFRSWWFFIAAAFMLLSLTISLFSKVYGKIVVLDPMVFHDKPWLQLTHENFMIDMVHFSGEAYAENNKLIECKWKLHVTSLTLFLLAVACLVMWMAAGS